MERERISYEIIQKITRLTDHSTVKPKLHETMLSGTMGKRNRIQSESNQVQSKNSKTSISAKKDWTVFIYTRRHAVFPVTGWCRTNYARGIRWCTETAHSSLQTRQNWFAAVCRATDLIPQSICRLASISSSPALLWEEHLAFCISIPP